MKRFRDIFDYRSHTIIDSEIKNDFDCNPEKYKKCLDSSILTHMHTHIATNKTVRCICSS